MGCIALFYTLFQSLEDQGLLDRDNNNDLFFLHYIFLPRLNHVLNVFRESYNHHPLTTASNKSPYPLWISGMAEQSSDDAAVRGVEEDLAQTRKYLHQHSTHLYMLP